MISQGGRSGWAQGARGWEIGLRAGGEVGARDRAQGQGPRAAAQEIGLPEIVLRDKRLASARWGIELRDFGLGAQEQRLGMGDARNRVFWLEDRDFRAVGVRAQETEARAKDRAQGQGLRAGCTRTRSVGLGEVEVRR